MTVDEVAALIGTGRPLLISGAEALLRTLPRGLWLGGTIPYFMTEDGGRQTQELLLANEFPEACLGGEVKLYAESELPQIPGDCPDHGVSFIVIPAGSAAHATYAKESSSWPGFFDRPVVGWISGVALDRLATEQAKVVNGQTGEVRADAAGLLHLQLSPTVVAKTEIINLFEPSGGDVIKFPQDGFSVSECIVNGEPRDFAQYLVEQKADARWPLVADFSGANINVSFQSIDAAARRVTFYGPVFQEVEYRLAKPVTDYVRSFDEVLARRGISPIFTCNCILNYEYAELEGKRTGHVAGPITFGEVAWMLLNQTMVYVTLEPLRDSQPAAGAGSQ